MDGTSDQRIEISCIPGASSHEQSIDRRLENQCIRIGGVDAAAVQKRDFPPIGTGYFIKGITD